MPLYKSAQAHSPEDEVIIFNDPSAINLHVLPSEDHMEVEEPEGFKFSFPEVATSDAEIEVSDDSDSKPSEQTGPRDIWDWQAGGISSLMDWVQERINQMPTHSGETSGIERLVNYLKRLNGEISKAISTDFEGKIDVKTLEGARGWIYNSINKLEDAHENLLDKHYRKKKKAAASDEDAIVKEARTAYTGGIIVSVPLLISTIARMVINGSVSQGHDPVSIYENQVKRFKLDLREQAELVQHLEDMGFPVTRDRAFLPGNEVVMGSGMGELGMGYYA